MLLSTEKKKAIPEGYMTVGEVAKKMKTTVRALQYYDAEGVLSPSLQSEGGRRLYTDRDIVRLHQIQSLKYLGFSLDDIKNRLPALDTPAEVSAALTEQAAVIRSKIEELSEVLNATEKLRDMTVKMETVDWGRYADIVVCLRTGNENYGYIANFNDKLMSRVNSLGRENGDMLIKKFKRLITQGEELPKRGVTPESERGQAFAKEWWDCVTEFTGGDMSMIPELMKISDNMSCIGKELELNWNAALPFVKRSLEVYFSAAGFNYEEETK